MGNNNCVSVETVATVATSVGNIELNAVNSDTLTTTAGAIECDKCLKGFHQLNKGSTTCLECIPGRYQDQQEQSKCIDCRVGRVSRDVARDFECELCKKGFHHLNIGSTTCLQCIPGRYQDQQEQRKCIECPGGRSSNQIKRGSNCDLCKKGEYTIGRGSVSCSTCGAGKFGREVGTCSMCPIGWFRGDGYVQTDTCVQCQVGETTITDGSASCSLCDFGKFGSEAGICDDCKEGQYQDSKGQHQCMDCNLGEVTVGQTGCYKCESGRHGLTHKPGLCENCPSHLYQDNKGQPACKICKDGKIPNKKNTACAKPEWTVAADCQYNLEYLNNTMEDKFLWNCVSCPEGAVCSAHSTWAEVVARKGYWRVDWSWQKSVFYKCPYHLDCRGVDDSYQKKELIEFTNLTNGTHIYDGLEGCLEGTTGPMCSICEPGYNRDTTTCKKCTNESFGVRVGIVLVILVMLILLIKSCKKRMEKKWRKYKPLWRDILAIASINVTFAQVNSSLPAIIDVSWPVEWQEFVSNFCTFNVLI
jgi:hypothetical protein